MDILDGLKYSPFVTITDVFGHSVLFLTVLYRVPVEMPFLFKLPPHRLNKGRVRVLHAIHSSLLSFIATSVKLIINLNRNTSKAFDQSCLLETE